MSACPPKAPKVIHVVWLAPKPSWIKVNIDGAAIACPSCAGCGGVFRTSCGFVRGCFWSSIHLAYAFEVELLALKYVKAFGWDFLWIEIDSSFVVNALQTCSLKVPCLLCWIGLTV